MSMPGTAEQKRPLIECMSCHTFERIVRSTYDADTFVPVLKRMAQYANNTTQARVQSRVAARDVNDDFGAQARRLSGDDQSERATGLDLQIADAAAA